MENTYRYTITLEYEMDKKLYKFDHTRIHNLLIDYDYNGKNMPVLYLKIALDKKILDDMKKNIGKKTVILTVNKYLEGLEPKIEKKYIKDEFIYFMDNNLNNMDDLDYGHEQNEELHQLVTIGLAKLELINNNKKVINDIFDDTTMINMLCKYLGNRKLLIEPLAYKKPIPKLIIPPVDTLSKFIKYLDGYKSLYTSAYRLFYDFDKTYLLSSSGKAIPSKDEQYHSVIININNTISNESKVQGIETDHKRKAYIMELDITDVNTIEHKHDNISVNNILAIGYDGTTTEVDINSKDYKIKNTKISRFRNDNYSKANEHKYRIEEKTAITINKTDIDTSLFTMNKEYMVKNYEKLRKKDGRYVLVRKREIYTRKDEDFKILCIFTLQQLLEEKKKK